MPAIKRQNGKAVIGTGGAQAAVIGVAFLVFPMLMLIGFFSGGSQQNQPVIFPILFFSVFTIIGLVAMLSAKNTRYEVDDEGLRSFDLLGRKNGDIRWSEVSQYQMDSSAIGGSSFVRA